MMTLHRQSMSTESFGSPALALPEKPRIDSTTLAHYLHGLRYPVNKRDILNQAESMGAPDNVMAFFVNRLPMRQFRSASDISFTVFVSSYMFGQD